jgi:hypothetical protein
VGKPVEVSVNCTLCPIPGFVGDHVNLAVGLTPGGTTVTLKEMVAPAVPTSEMLSPPAEPLDRNEDGSFVSLIAVRPAWLE